jgi:hypothetical protein
MSSATEMPQVIARYLHAADIRDYQACADCFTEDGTVLDEGKTYTGRDQIYHWRADGVSQWTYTTTITGSEAVSATEYRVTVDVDGDFPGGHASLTYDFRLRDELIADLRIVE